LEVDVDGPAREDLANAVCTCVTGVLETLKPEYRDSIRAVDLEGRELRGFATDAGITAHNAAVRLHRAREARDRRLHQRAEPARATDALTPRARAPAERSALQTFTRRCGGGNVALQSPYSRLTVMRRR
jgi:hypothetical protein